MTAKTEGKPDDRWALRMTDHTHGRIANVHDSRPACDAALAAHLKQWGLTKDDVEIEWADLSEASGD